MRVEKKIKEKTSKGKQRTKRRGKVEKRKDLD